MKIKAYPVISEAVDDGVAYGITRIFKHFDKNAMTEEEMRERQETLVDCIMNELCEVIDFDSDPQEL